MRYVVAYDVESDRVRTRIAKVLTGYGNRVQYSVFECDLDGNDLTRLVQRLTRALGTQEAGSVRIYRLCADCVNASRVIGLTEIRGDDPCIIID